MNYSAEAIDLGDGQRKFIHTWLPRQTPSAALTIVHGLGEHGGRYRSLATELATAGMAVVAFDQQGHGQSPERRGCIASYDGLLEDIGAVLGWSGEQFKGVPQVLFGHSMGGNLVLYYALRKLGQPPVDAERAAAAARVQGATGPRPTAIIASSPMLRAVREPGPLFHAVARFLLKVAPNLRLKSDVVAERLMSDPAEQRDFYADPLFHSRLSLRLGAGMLDSGRWMLDNAATLAVPTLVTHGTNDHLTSPQASAEFARRAGELCQLELYTNQLHDTFRDLERDHVIERFIDFVRSHDAAADRSSEQGRVGS